MFISHNMHDFFLVCDSFHLIGNMFSLQIKTKKKPADPVQNASGRITRAHAQKYVIKINSNGLESTKKRKLADTNESDGTNPKRRKISNTSLPVSIKGDSIALEPDQLAVPSKECPSNKATMSTLIPAQQTNFLQVAIIEFAVNEIVWAKIKGHNAWPAQIISFPTNKMVLVRWFNDYRETKIYRTQIFKFLLNFDRFSVNFNKTAGLYTAAREALYSYAALIKS